MGNWHLKGEPYEVQTVAQRFAAGRRGYGYFLEQGLGKTALALNEYIELRRSMSQPCNKLVVISLYTMMEEWQGAAKDWTKDAVALSVWPKTDGRDGVVINYEALLYSGGEFLAEYLKGHRVMLILDDSSRIKNPSSWTARWVLAHAPRAAYVRLLVGTPMTQSVMDLYPQLRAMGALEGVNRYAFRNKYAIMGGYRGKQILGVKNEESLTKLLALWAFTAKKKDWSDIPDKVYGTRKVKMEKKQQAAYDQMLHDFYIELQDGAEVSAHYAITQGEKLQQISSGFVIDEDRNVHSLVSPAKNPKLRAVKEHLEVTEGKVIIAALHTHVIDLLLANLAGYVAVIRGKACMKELGRTVQQEKEYFNNEPSCRVIAVQIQSGAFGHTLLGKTGEDRCATTIHFENSYSLLLRSQLEDRNHRFGQDTSPYHLDILASPVEAKVVAALQRKTSIASAIMDAVRTYGEAHV